MDVQIHPFVITMIRFEVDSTANMLSNKSLRVLTYIKRTLCYSFSLEVIFLVLTSERFELLLKYGCSNSSIRDHDDALRS